MSTAPGPATGPASGSVLEPASWARRIGALFLDWIACSLVTLAIVGGHGYTHQRGANWLPLIVFWVESGLGTALVGASFGQLVTRIRVLRADGSRLALLPALARSFLICLVIPPLVFKPDGRGLHDLATYSGAYHLPRG